MTRQELEHIIRAAAGTANTREVVVIGSQAILGSHPDAPKELTESMEADVFPKDTPERSIVIDGAIGELSLFHQTFGYFAHGVDETTAILPDGWKERLVKVETPGTAGAIGWCLEPHDLAVSKLVAGREKDLAFVEAMIREGLVSTEVIRERLSGTTRLDPARRQLTEARLDGTAPA
ncbi:MAG TPA: DUF6036 family nucleotidyltransferase [Tepidisphaeraceae bacterium]|nr:DUF6036 family nucleotidyltransferase [Tepidisphaeraceae bacterium]